MSNVRYPDEYIRYLAEYNGSRDYFECHEIMEAYWKAHPDSPYRLCWLVLIRVAVCLYHARRGNWTGAARLMSKAAAEAERAAELFSDIGIDGAALADSLLKTLLAWKAGETRYDDIALPLTDPQLTAEALALCGELGYRWNTPGLEAGDDIVHRHLTRDRSEVVQARAESAERKAARRSSGTP